MHHKVHPGVKKTSVSVPKYYRVTSVTLIHIITVSVAVVVFIFTFVCSRL